ncbi:MAG: isopeptide-forming domain-containing fimbrial protein, partial [Chloroflexota bacterium]
GSSGFAFLGAERVVNNGTMVVDFELNKKPFKVYAAGEPPKPDRSAGDLLISLEYSNGGSNPIVTIYAIANVVNLAHGQTVSFVPVTDATVKSAVRSATNFVDLTSSGFGYTVPAFDFAEASIDLSKLGISTSCPGFSTGQIRSRTGGDPGSSQLKDTARPFDIDLNNCGSVTVIKNAVPNDAQDFAYTTTGGAPLANFSLDNDGDNTNALSNTKDFTKVPPGDYTVTEGSIAGWKLTGLTCDDNNSTGNESTRVASIHVEANEHVTCTYVNTKLGSITIVKDAVPNDAQDFAFTGDVGAFSLDDDSNATLPSTRTFTNLDPGSYAVTEGALSGWDLTGLSCDDNAGTTVNIGTRTATIDLDPGQDITCTYTNTKRGSITIIKDASPNDPQDFAYTGLGGFTLDDDSDATLSNTFTSGNLAPGSYTVTETDVTGWELTGLTCDDGDGGTTISVANRQAVIDLDPGQSITCTYVNTKAGRIFVDKVTNPAGDPASFAFDPSWSASNFNLTDAAAPHDSGDLKPGTYSVAELALAGWDLTGATCDDGSSPDSITLSAGEVVTCTFTNTKRGHILIDKVTNPAGAPDSFEFDPSYSGTNFSLTDAATPNDSGALVPGTYSVAELALAGWDLTGTSCTDGSPVSGIVLGAGETVTCTFTNTKRGTIIVEKQTSPDGAAGQFTFTGDAAGSIGDNGQIVVTNLVPGTYTSTEGPTGLLFDLGAVTCDDANSVGNVETSTATFHLEAGETVKCTFTNVQRGTITIIKDADPTDPQDFGFTTTGTGLSPFSLDDDGDNANTLSNTTTFQNLLAGSYSVTESATSGWDLTGITCEAGGTSSFVIDGATANLTLTVGGSLTCVYHNNKPSIDIVKTAGNAADGDEFVSPPGPVTYHYHVTNNGATALENVVVTDDNGTPGDTSDDFTADCPAATLAVGASMDCSKTVQVTANRTNTGTAHAFSVGGTPVQDTDIAFVRIPGVAIDKSADDDLVEQNQTVTYTIVVTVTNGPVTAAVVTDTLPAGQTYVAGSSIVAGSASEPVVTDGGKTLTWALGTLDTEDSPLTITYDVKIDADATTAKQVNEVELCVSELPNCVPSDEDVTPQIPAIHIVKTAGDAADGAVFTTLAGPVTYHYTVTNTGPLALHDVVVTDDHGTPADTSDDIIVTCPETELAAAGQEGDSMECTATVTVNVDTTNVALAEGTSPEGNSVHDDDDAVVQIRLVHTLTIDKSNSAPLKTIELPDGTSVQLPTAPEGATVTFTLHYTFSDSPDTNGIITDVLPAGLTYVTGSATSNDEFKFVSYTAATRTLKWTAEDVTKSGTVTYQAKVDIGAAKLKQPLTNVATIDSDQTEPDDDTSQVYVPVPPKAETAPPTDVEAPTQTGTPGSSLPLILGILAAIFVTVAFVTPVPATARRRNRQR